MFCLRCAQEEPEEGGGAPPASQEGAEQVSQVLNSVELWTKISPEKKQTLVLVKYFPDVLMKDTNVLDSLNEQNTR